MAKKAVVQEQDSSQEVDLQTRIAELEKENAELKAAQNKATEEAKAPEAEAKPSVTLQHIGRMRQFTVPRSQVTKIHRGTAKIDHPRLSSSVVLTPGCVIDAEPKLAEYLISTLDFQKYGVK